MAGQKLKVYNTPKIKEGWSLRDGKEAKPLWVGMGNLALVEKRGGKRYKTGVAR
jgi:hypothetical protein